MGAIGNYIHLKAENYLVYGVAQNQKSIRRPSKIEVYRAQHTKNLAQINSLADINPSTLEELKQRIKNNSEKGKEKAELSVKHAALGRKLVDRCIDSFKQSFERSSAFREGLASRIEKAKKNDNIEFNIKKVSNARRNCLRNIETINSNFKKGKPIEQRTIDALLKNFDDFFNLLGIQINLNNKDVKKWLANKFYEKQPMHLALQDAIRAVAYSEIDNATKQGQMGEQTVALCGDVALNVAQQGVNGIIRGAEVSQFSLNEDIISKNIQKIIKKETKLNLYQVRTSQNKVDVSITVKNQPLDVSVKAYSTRGNSMRVHLQDINLLYSLAATVPHFANHWLNLHALKLNSTSLDFALEEAMRYEALASGNLLKQNASLANTFVAIDVSGGNVYAASTKDILLGRSGNNILLRPDIRSIQIENNKAITVEQRIANIVRQLHRQKISATMRISFKS